MAKTIKVFILVLCIGYAIAGCNRDNQVKLKSEWDVVSFGNEITWIDYAEWTAAAVADAFGCSGSCTSVILQSIITSLTNEVVEQIEAIGPDTILQLISSGESLELESATIKGGILSYDCWIDDCNCCSWGCGQALGIPCTGCSCQQCGSTRRDEPNHQQPYLAIRNKKFMSSIPITKLTEQQSLCTQQTINSIYCINAAGRLCRTKFKQVGIIGNSNSKNVVVLCTIDSSLHNINANEAERCISTDYQALISNGCVADSKRWCENNGYGGAAYIQEANGAQNELLVGCIKTVGTYLIQYDQLRSQCLDKPATDYLCITHLQTICKEKTHGNGNIGQVVEWGTNDVQVACYNTQVLQ